MNAESQAYADWAMLKELRVWCTSCVAFGGTTFVWECPQPNEITLSADHGYVPVLTIIDHGIAILRKEHYPGLWGACRPLIEGLIAECKSAQQARADALLAKLGGGDGR